MPLDDQVDPSPPSLCDFAMDALPLTDGGEDNSEMPLAAPEMPIADAHAPVKDAIKTKEKATLPSTTNNTSLKDRPLTDRLEYILGSVTRAGFRNFDSMVSDFYTADLTSFPMLANEQRLGRNRRLPRVLADLRANMEGWTRWEAQGCRNEILEFAESIFSAEIQKLRNDKRLHAGFDSSWDGKQQDEDVEASISDASVEAIAKLFQDEVSFPT